MSASKKQWITCVSLLVIFLFSFTAIALAVDGYESDDDPADAQPITIGETQNRSISPVGDVDYLTFTVGSSTYIVIETNGTEGDTILALYDDVMSELAYDDDSGNGLFSRIIYTVDPGTYYIRVEEYTGTVEIANYSISLSDATDVYEPDDDPVDAKTITIGETQYRSLSPAGDLDYLTFTAGATTTVDIETFGNSGDTELTLFDSSMIEIAYDDDGGSDHLFSKIIYTLDPGQYYILVDEFSGNELPFYSISLSIGVAPGSISGTVIDSSSGTPLDNLWVLASNADTHEFGGDTFTDEFGDYTITGLPPGDYIVEIYAPPYIEEYYNNAYDWDSATRVTVTSDVDTPNINFALDMGGSISGTVTDSSTGLPIESMYVCVQGINTQATECGWTQADGTYTITPVLTDSYIVGVDTGGTQYIAEYYNNAYDMNSAASVPVTAGVDTPNIDFALETGGSISGTVNDSSTGLPVGGMWVNVNDGDWNNYGGAQTDINGDYYIGGLPTRNDYSVSVQGNATYASQTQEPKSVTAPGNTVVDFSLLYGGSISGTVTDAVSGLGLEGVAVAVFDASGEGWLQVGWAQTDSDGIYYAEGIPEGSWLVSAFAEGQGYVRQMYDGAISEEDATPVPVTAGQTSTGIDFALIKGGSISGIVTDSGGTPLAGARVEAQLTGNGDTWLGDTETDGQGNYTLNALPPGEVLVVAAAPGTNLVGQYYSGALYSNDADPVTVEAENTTTGIDFSLNEGGMLTGVLTADGSPVSEGYMSAYSVDEGRWMFMSAVRGSVVDGQTGTWTMAVPAGTYKIMGNAENIGGYPEKYYGNTNIFADATEVTVTGTETVSGLDIDLTADAAAIEGTLIYGGSQTGTAIFYITPTIDGVWPDVSGAEGGYTGNYSLGNIPAGTWYVKAFIDVDGDLIFDVDEPSGEYAGGAVTVGIGETAGGIDITIVDPVQTPTKIGVCRDGDWYLDANGDMTWDTSVDSMFSFGIPGDVPVTGDWDGTGSTKVGVVRNYTWYLDMDGNGMWDPGADAVFEFGIPGDIPVTGDWDGDSRTEIGVVRGFTWYLDMNGNRVWDPGVDAVFEFGIPGDIPVTGDWDGDSRTEIGVVRGFTWYLDMNGNRVWDSGTDQVFEFGIPGDVPVTGDWDGTGSTKVGVVRNYTWYLDMNGNGVWDSGTDQVFEFGIPGDVPVTGKW